MKIHQLNFKNINSLRGEHAVDFDAAPLKGAGLFAITGPTGAGKTTLLDVISLALYSQIPRVSTGRGVNKGLIEKTGLVLTENTSEAWAEVTFTCKAGRFKSRWSIAKARTGNLKDHEMEVFDCQANQLVDLKKSEVPAFIERLVGLTYDQFIRSMLLAQGEFARFLKTDKKERSELLEKITGSEIYRLIGRKAFEKNKEFGQELERMLDRERELKAEQLPEEEYKTLLQSLGAADQALAQANEQKQAAQQALKDKEGYLTLAHEAEQLTLDLDEAKAAIKAFEASEGPRLKQHESLLPHAEDLEAWQRAKAERDKLEHEGARWQQKEERAKEAVALVSQKLQNLVGSSAEDAALLEALDDLEKRVATLQEQRQAALVRFDGLKKQASPLAERADLRLDFREPSESRGKALEQQKKLQVAHVKAAALVPPAWVEDLALGQEAWQERQAKLLHWRQLNAQAAELTTQHGKYAPRLVELGEQSKVLPDQLKALEERQGRLEAERHGLKKDLTIHQLQAQVEDLRPKLREGEPCPLCGAVHHPYAEHLPDTLPSNLEKQLETKEKELRQTETELTQKQQQYQQLEERQKELTTELQEIAQRQTEVQLEQERLWEGFAEEDIPQDVDLWETELRQQKEALKVLAENQSQMESLRELASQLSEMETVVLAGKEVSGQIKELYSGADIRQEANVLRGEYERTQTQRKEALEGHQRWEKEKTALSQKVAGLEESLIQKLDGYAHPEAAYAHLLKPAVYAELSRQANQLRSRAQSLEEKLADRQTRLAEQPDTLAEATTETLQESAEQAQGVLAEKQQVRDALHAQQVVQARLRDEQASLTEKISKQKAENERWVLLKQYIGDAKGEKFSAFAQDLTLQHLVGMANRRLAHLTSRYRLTMPEPDENTDDSLAVVDQDLGQMQRSVKTLSGGESFLISLALALGLSDLASQEVEIGSLFIDEGFGTLDPETLDLTLNTLERLQAEGGKTIGVISHVDALKERIATQIQVVPNGQGYSTLRVV